MYWILYYYYYCDLQTTEICLNQNPCLHTVAIVCYDGIELLTQY